MNLWTYGRSRGGGLKNWPISRGSEGMGCRARDLDFGGCVDALHAK